MILDPKKCQNMSWNPVINSQRRHRDLRYFILIARLVIGSLFALMLGHEIIGIALAVVGVLWFAGMFFTAEHVF